jgi:hypothetical protein
MKAQVITFLIVMGVISSCAKIPGQFPEDFNVVLNWDTGALPPQYHYHYKVVIGPGSQGDFVYGPGYEDDNPETWTTSFEVTSDDLQSLYDYLKENNVLRNQWESGQPLLGGQGTRVAVTASGQQYLIPSVSEVSRGERELIEQVIDKIKSFVPQSIWDEMNSRQSAYENDHSS